VGALDRAGEEEARAHPRLYGKAAVFVALSAIVGVTGLVVARAANVDPSSAASLLGIPGNAGSRPPAGVVAPLVAAPSPGTTQSTPTEDSVVARNLSTAAPTEPSTSTPTSSSTPTPVNTQVSILSTSLQGRFVAVGGVPVERLVRVSIDVAEKLTLEVVSASGACVVGYLEVETWYTRDNRPIMFYQEQFVACPGNPQTIQPIVRLGSGSLSDCGRPYEIRIVEQRNTEFASVNRANRYGGFRGRPADVVLVPNTASLTAYLEGRYCEAQTMSVSQESAPSSSWGEK
jgi:hypothetical protein